MKKEKEEEEKKSLFESPAGRRASAWWDKMQISRGGREREG